MAQPKYLSKQRRRIKERYNGQYYTNLTLKWSPNRFAGLNIDVNDKERGSHFSFLETLHINLPACICIRQSRVWVIISVKIEKYKYSLLPYMFFVIYRSEIKKKFTKI